LLSLLVMRELRIAEDPAGAVNRRRMVCPAVGVHASVDLQCFGCHVDRAVLASTDCGGTHRLGGRTGQ
jgi:hypothetical protein